MTTITGTFNSTPSTNGFRLEFFASVAADSSGFGEGQTFLGFTTVDTDASGNATFSVTLPVTVPAGQFVTATATGSGGTSEFSRVLSTSAAASADLAVSVAGTPDTVARGGADHLHGHGHRRRPDDAQDVTLAAPIPAGTTMVSFSTASGWTITAPAVGSSGGTITAKTSALAATASPVAFTFVVSVGGGAADGSTISVSASVASATTSDPNDADNSAGTTTTVAATTPPVAADLEVTQSASPGTATVGQDAVTFAITVTNRGPASASNVTLLETLPAAATFVSATGGVTPSDGKLTFPLGDMATGSSLTFSIVVRPRSAGTLTASATASATEADPSTANNTATASLSAADPTIVPTPTPTPTSTPTAGIDGPHILGVQRFGIHTMPTTVVLTFDVPLGAAAARDVKNYRITDTDGARIAVRSAVYDAAAHTVALRMARRISIHRPYKLVIRGTVPDGLSDDASHLLDGQRPASPAAIMRPH